MKIVIGEVSHETNTFSNVPTDEALFRLREWSHGDAIIDEHRGVRDSLGGMVDRAEALGIEVVGSFAATAAPAGTIPRKTFETLRDELVSGIAAAGEVDAVCLSLHGAGVAEGVDDLEGAILEAVRAQVGGTPIVVTLDLHANMTPQMVDLADAMFGNHLYPHTDSYERGVEAVDTARRIVQDGLRPTLSLVRLPLMIPTSTTNLDPAKTVNARCYEQEAVPGVIDCTFYHGFPHTDTPHVATSVLVTTEGDREQAERVANEIAGLVWAQREGFTPTSVTPEDGVARALRHPTHPIVINETSDNPGGGTPGDGTHLLRELLAHPLGGAKTCFGFIYDPDVANQAHEAGVGTTLNLRLGGKTDTLHGAPLDVTAYVKTLTDGRFVLTSPMGRGRRVDLGKSVRLQIEGAGGVVDVLVCSVKSQVLDAQVFVLHGINVTDYKIVALKSSQHFRAGFGPIAAEIITVDSPGLSSLQLSTFTYQRIRRPIYPLEPATFG
ncbi:MAG: M81 family metallopeptidase [Trueperaceae bacterium]|nr:M81 family metallopeptidase [Trueperaceae bacterium]